MNIRIKFATTAALAVLTSFPLLAAEGGEPLARVGEVEITVADIQPRIAALSDAEREALVGNPALLNQFVRSLIVQQMVLREALAAGWDKEPEVVKQLEQMRETAITQGFLRSVGEPAEDYPSEAEVKAAYDENKDALRVPKQYRLAQIFVAQPEGSGKEAAAMAKVKVDEIQAALKAPGADFAAIARGRSEEPQSAAQGGEVGWLTAEQIQPGIREQLGDLVTGVVSAPIQLADGIHIVKVLEVKEAYTPELAEVADALRQRMRAVKAEQNSEAHVVKLLEANPIAINEIRLTELLPKAADQ